MNWSFVSSKVFWLDVITILIGLGQQIIGNNIWPQYATIITMIIVVLGLIANAIVGGNNAVALMTARRELAAANRMLAKCPRA